MILKLQVSFFVKWCVLVLFIANPNFFIVKAQEGVVIREWVTPALEEKSPLLFVEFWATWCVPCRHVQPHINNLYEGTNGNIDFVQISDESSYKVKKYIQKFGAHHPVALDYENRTHKNFEVTYLPFALILNDQSEVIWSGSPSDLSVQDLSDLYDQFENRSLPNPRISLQTIADVEEVNKTEIGNFITFKKVAYTDNLSRSSGKHKIFRGDLRYILTKTLDFMDAHVQVDSSLKKVYWEVEMDSSNIKEGIFEFLKMNEIKIDLNQREVVSYNLNIIDPSKFWSSSIYDYGDGGYIAGDYSIEIDNATITRVAELITKFSDFEVHYEGVDTFGIHDWNIYYKDTEGMRQQLEHELGMELIGKAVETKILEVKRKN